MGRERGQRDKATCRWDGQSHLSCHFMATRAEACASGTLSGWTVQGDWLGKGAPGAEAPEGALRPVAS